MGDLPLKNIKEINVFNMKEVPQRVDSQLGNHTVSANHFSDPMFTSSSTNLACDPVCIDYDGTCDWSSATSAIVKAANYILSLS